jgi:hypothetical protein
MFASTGVFPRNIFLFKKGYAGKGRYGSFRPGNYNNLLDVKNKKGIK